MAFETSVLAYLAAFCSYSEALWSSTEAETKMVYSTLFRLVGSMTQQVRTAQQQLQTALLEADIEIPEVQADCPNAGKARTIRKRERLNALAKLVALTQNVLKSGIFKNLNACFATRTEYKFSLFSARKNIRLSAPHYTQRQLF